jgi:hypothetical protein
VGAGLRAGALDTGLRAGGLRVGEVRPRDAVRDEVFLSGVLRNTSQENSNVVIRSVKMVRDRGLERYFFMRKRIWPDYFFKNNVKSLCVGGTLLRSCFASGTLAA